MRRATELGICKQCKHLGTKEEGGWCTNHSFWGWDRLPYILYSNKQNCGGYNDNNGNDVAGNKKENL